MKVLIASKVATMAFTPKAAEKAAVPSGKNQIFAVPGALDEGGCINAAIIAKEVPEAPSPLSQ